MKLPGCNSVRDTTEEIGVRFYTGEQQLLLLITISRANRLFASLVVLLAPLLLLAWLQECCCLFLLGFMNVGLLAAGTQSGCMAKKVETTTLYLGYHLDSSTS